MFVFTAQLLNSKQRNFYNKSLFSYEIKYSRCIFSVLLRWANAFKVWAYAIKVWANASKQNGYFNTLSKHFVEIKNPFLLVFVLILHL